MPLPLQQRLARLRLRLRTWFLTAGVCRLGCEILVFGIVAYALDRWLDFPPAVRQVLFVLVAVALIWRVGRLLWYPMRRRFRLEDMALAVERRHRELSGELASSVELARVVENPPADVSPALLRQWLEQVDRRVSGMRVEDVFDRRPTLRIGAVMLVLGVGVGAFAASEPGETRVFLQRLIGGDVAWPRRTHLSIDVPGSSKHYRVTRDERGHPARVVVVRGASMPFEVSVEGSVPDDVFLVVEEDGAFSRSEEVRMLREEDTDRFVYRFRNLSRPFHLHPEGGDDSGRDRVVAVDVLPPPTVEKIVASLNPPPYTGINPSKEERQDFRAPVGTKIDLEIFTSGNAVRGTATFDNDPQSEVVLTAEPEGGTHFYHTFTVEKSGTLNLHLESDDGFENLLPLDYVVTAIDDRRPTAEIVLPRVSNVEVTPAGVVPFQMALQDDYGVARADLVFRMFGERIVGEERLIESTVGGSGALGEPLEIFHIFDLSMFRVPAYEAQPESALERGQTLAYQVRVADNRENADREPSPNVLETALRSLEVVSEGEKVRKLSERQLALKQAIAKIRESQEEQLASLHAVRDSWDDEAMDRARELTALEVEESRLATRARQVTRDFADVVDEYIFNRLDSSATRDRVLDHRLGQLQARSERHGLDVDALRSLIETWSNGNFGTLSLLDNYFAMLGLVLDASEIHAAEALAKLREARVSHEDERRPRLLAEAAEAEQALIDTYSQLLEKMEEWENFQDLLEDLRRLKDDSNDILRRVRRGGEGDDGG